MSRLAIVSASTDLARAQACIRSWATRAVEYDIPTFVVENGTDDAHPYLGTVPAFRRGVDHMLQWTDAEIICNFHDDFEILEDGWDAKVLRYFDRHPAMGLAGFGGAIGLGAHDLYDKPYDPMSLARIGFRSDLVDAEQHGLRSLLAESVACLDGFSQIGRRQFWEGWQYLQVQTIQEVLHLGTAKRPWTVLENLGIVHHFQDGALGCLAKRYGWETWYIPLRSKHYGGQTAVGDQGYQAWAHTQVAEGDKGFWLHAHKVAYEAFRDVLPIRV